MHNNSTTTEAKPNELVCNAALDLIARHGWQIFPARFAQNKDGKWDKKSWKAAKHSNGRAWGMTKDPDEIRRDFKNSNRTAIGVPTGKINKFFVIEADTIEGHDVDGLASLKQLEAEYGPLPETFMVESPTGSLHYYFKHPGGDLKIKCGTIAPGVDIKGDGGMVIAAPSLRPDKGWYHRLNDLPIADAPDQWIERVKRDANDDGADRDEQRVAPLWKVTRALAAIPNDANADVDRQQWIEVGLATHAATAGSDVGLAEFDKWSRQWPDYSQADTHTAWKSFKPQRIGAGTLFYLANQHDPNWWRCYQPGDDGPLPLGFTRDGGFAFYDQKRRLIIPASANQLLSPQWLLGMMPFKFWIERFLADNKLGFNPFTAGEALMEACRRAGPFNPQWVRGRGIWREGDTIIINLGGPMPATTKHRYVCFEPVEFTYTTEFNIERLLRLFQLFSWKHPQDAVLLLGWAALAPICGVFDWRPHGFILGDAETGKTTLHGLLKTLLSPLVISTEGGSSEAGIRQTLGPDSLPVIIDEFESDQQSIPRILKLMRSASSADNPLLRGTPEGRAMQFSLRATFLVCAVNRGGLSPADESRILTLELMKHDKNKEVARTIETELAHFRELGPQWCGYLVSLAGLMQPALEAFQLEMPAADRHHRQNFATVLSAAFVALHGRVPAASEAQQWVKDYASAMERHAEDNTRDNPMECLEQLKAFIVEHHTLGRWIATALQPAEHLAADEKYKHDDAWRVLSMYGITIKKIVDEQMVCIRNGSPNINAIYRGTVWRERGWQNPLRRLDGARTSDDPIRFSKDRENKHRATLIPAHYFPDPPITQKPYDGF